VKDNFLIFFHPYLFGHIIKNYYEEQLNYFKEIFFFSSASKFDIIMPVNKKNTRGV